MDKAEVVRVLKKAGLNAEAAWIEETFPSPKNERRFAKFLRVNGFDAREARESKADYSGRIAEEYPLYRMVQDSAKVDRVVNAMMDVAVTKSERSKRRAEKVGVVVVEKPRKRKRG